MPVDTREERLARRIADLYATDQQFADARPSEAITAAIDQPGLRLPQLVRTVMEGYADRPALGQRAVRFVNDGETGRTSVELLPRFETITYRELWDRVGAIATGLAGDPVRPGDRVCVLGFTSVDYTTVDMALVQIGAVSVPLQTSAPVAQLRPIVAETEPSVIAASVDYLDDAVELVLDRTHARTADRVRLPPRGGRPARGVGSRQVAVGASGQPGDCGNAGRRSRKRGGSCRPHRLFVPDEDDPLTLLIYTSGSTGAPKGAMQPERLVAKLWRKSASWGQQHSAEPWITLSFMPMSHLMGRGSLYGTLGKGGTAYFAAKSDLSTFLDDLALVRPTRLDFVPRIWDMLFGEFQSELDRRSSSGADRAALEATVMAEQRQNLLGGRFVCGADGLRADLGRDEGIRRVLPRPTPGGTLTARPRPGSSTVDGQVRRPPVIDYKLADVPDLGYFRTDQPHPRGELLVKSDDVFPGYYKRPEVTAEVFDPDGYYRTGDIMAEVGPDQLVYLDRRNNVLKLSQGEFVTVSKLEAVFGDSPLVAADLRLRQQRTRLPAGGHRAHSGCTVAQRRRCRRR